MQHTSHEAEGRDGEGSILSHLVSYLLETWYAGSCLGQVKDDKSKLREKKSVILCSSITLNSACECISETICYIIVFLEFNMIWNLFVYFDFFFQ